MVLTRRNAIAFAAIIYSFVPLQSTFAEAIINPACSNLKMINNEIQRIKVQSDSIDAGDTARRCPLYKEKIKYNDEMIMIFESDSNRCGVGNAVLERLKASRDKLRETSSSACAEAIINNACSNLKMIGDELKRIKEQRESSSDSDKAQRCPLYKQQIQYNEEMIKIFESDSNRCGARNEVIEQLKTTTDKLRVSSSAACG
jgi:hypothetical protein